MEKLALTVAGETIENPVSALPGEGIPALSVILQVGIGLLFIIAILASLVFIIWGGLDWITAGGNKENIQKARHKLIYAVLGFFVVFLAFFIMNIISQFFGIEFFKVPLNPNASFRLSRPPRVAKHCGQVRTIRSRPCLAGRQVTERLFAGLRGNSDYLLTKHKILNTMIMSL